jgi:hypothetical protein
MTRPYLYFRNSLDQVYCTIRYHQPNHMVSLIWHGLATEKSINNIKQGLHTMIVDFKPVAILNDTEGFFNLSSEILYELTSAEWDKAVADLGIRYIAHVLKADTKIPAAQRAPQHAMQIRFFYHKMDAVNWIREVQGLT